MLYSRAPGDRPADSVLGVPNRVMLVFQVQQDPSTGNRAGLQAPSSVGFVVPWWHSTAPWTFLTQMPSIPALLLNIGIGQRDVILSGIDPCDQINSEEADIDDEDADNVSGHPKQRKHNSHSYVMLASQRKP